MDSELPTRSEDRISPRFLLEDVGPARRRVVEAIAEEEDLGFDELWLMLKRQAWVIGLVFFLTLAAVAAYTWLKTPVWEAATLIRIDEDRTPTASLPKDFLPLLGGSTGELETEMRVVATKPILARVVEDEHLQFRLAEPPGTPRERVFRKIELSRAAPGAAYQVTRLGEDQWRIQALELAGYSLRKGFRSGDRVEIAEGAFVMATEAEMRSAGLQVPHKLRLETVEFDGALAGLKGSLQVSRPDRDANLFRVAYSGTDRFLVRNVVNSVAEAFLAQRQSVQKTEARSTVAFLREQSAQVRTELEAAETALQDFREEKQVVALESEAEEQVKRLAELQAQRSQLAAERTALDNLLQSIGGQSPGVRPDYRKLVGFPTFLGNRTIQSIVAALTAAESQRTQLRARWKTTHPGIVALDKQISGLEDQLGAIGRDYLASLNDQIASLDAVLTRFGTDLQTIPAKEIQFARLERQTKLLTALHSFLQQRLKEAEISEAVEDPSVRVVEAAGLPRSPVSPRPARNLALAAFLGLMLGSGIAFVRERMDRRIHADDDVSHLLAVPVLTRVPHLPSGPNNGGRQDALVTHMDARSLPAESYRTLRTNVTYANASNGLCEMVVTSPGAKDGKSVTASNLAVTFAQQGRRTLLLDADLRRSVQHRIFHVDRKPGLSEFLVGQVIFEEVCRGTSVDNLWLIPAGGTPPNPSELLSSPLMDSLIARVRDSFEAILIDTPPMLAVTDAAVLGGKLNGVLLVVRADRTHRKAAEDALDQLQRVGARVLGLVVNDARATGRYGYKYAYYYEYYSDDETRYGHRLSRLLTKGKP